MILGFNLFFEGFADNRNVYISYIFLLLCFLKKTLAYFFNFWRKFKLIFWLLRFFFIKTPKFIQIG